MCMKRVARRIYSFRVTNLHSLIRVCLCWHLFRIRTKGGTAIIVENHTTSTHFFSGSITEQSAINYCQLCVYIMHLMFSHAHFCVSCFLFRCSSWAAIEDQGSKYIRPYTASIVLLHWWVAETWLTLFPFYTLNAFIILSVLNISMSYSLLLIFLFPFLNKTHAETKVVMFGVLQRVFNSKDRNHFRSLVSSEYRNRIQTVSVACAADVGPVLKRDTRYDLTRMRTEIS